MSKLKLALAHDWLNQMGGAENVLETMVALFPNAPIFTTIYASELMPSTYKQWPIKTSWLNKAPGIHQHHQPYLPLYPAAVRGLDFSGYDVILSNKSGFIHGLKKEAGQKHLCYCLAPTRYAWTFEAYAAREQLNPALKLALKPLVLALQRWDYQAAQAVDHFCAISTEIQGRIKKYYNRDSIIIAPPVDTERFHPIYKPQGNYYYIVSRLIPYKRIDLAVQACTKLGKRLIITGGGRDETALRRLAGPTVEFTGRLPWDEVVALMANCRAFIFPGFEDFGITPVEAQAAGRPVIAYAAGGSLDTVIANQTGLFFDKQTISALCEAILKFETMNFDPAHIRQNAEKFSIPQFLGKLQTWLGQCLS